MKKKVLSIGAVAVPVAMMVFNANLGLNNKTSEMNVSLANIEALADCEDSVEYKKGRETDLECSNSSGETYTIRACDFDDGYITDCSGRPANT